ncbi:hypothetical protein BT69DRAFT_338535 [Atractiella rhizophila]|nr:hypothetical protein BT69DRAFT_338535 [Atractiella rhizophila]
MNSSPPPSLTFSPSPSPSATTAASATTPDLINPSAIRRKPSANAPLLLLSNSPIPEHDDVNIAVGNGIGSVVRNGPVHGIIGMGNGTSAGVHPGELESPDRDELAIGGVWNWGETSSNSTGSRESLRGHYALIEKERTQWLAPNDLMGGSTSSIGTTATGIGMGSGHVRSLRSAGGREGDEMDEASSISSYREKNTSPSGIGGMRHTPSLGGSIGVTRSNSNGSLNGRMASVGFDGLLMGGIGAGAVGEKTGMQQSGQQQQTQPQPHLQQSVQQNSQGSLQQHPNQPPNSASSHAQLSAPLPQQSASTDSLDPPSSEASSQPSGLSTGTGGTGGAGQSRSSSTLWMGDLEQWMESHYQSYQGLEPFFWLLFPYLSQSTTRPSCACSFLSGTANAHA